MLERLVCHKPSPDSIAHSFHCIFKHVSRTHLKMDFSVQLKKRVDTFWIRSVFYFKFNGITFQRFPIDLTEDICGWINGTARSFVMEVAYSKLLKYSNINHTCPYDAGPIWIKVDSIPEDIFTFELSFMPSGKYRVDLDYMESPSSAPFMKAALYFSVSDHRIEII